MADEALAARFLFALLVAAAAVQASGGECFDTVHDDIASWNASSVDEVLIRDQQTQPLVSVPMRREKGCYLQPHFTVVPMMGASATGVSSRVAVNNSEPVIRRPEPGMTLLIRALVACNRFAGSEPGTSDGNPGYYLSAEVAGPAAHVVPAITRLKSPQGQKEEEIFQLLWPLRDSGTFEVRIREWYDQKYFGFSGGCQNKQTKLIVKPSKHIFGSPAAFSILDGNMQKKLEAPLPFCSRGSALGRWVSSGNKASVQPLLTVLYGPTKAVKGTYEWSPIHCRLRTFSNVSAVADALATAFFAPHYGASEDQQVSPWVVNLHFIGDSTGFYIGGTMAAALSKATILNGKKFTNDVGDKFVPWSMPTHVTITKKGKVSLVVHTYHSRKAISPQGQASIVREIKKRPQLYSPRKGDDRGGGESHVFVFGDSTAHYNCPRVGWKDFEKIRAKTKAGTQELIREVQAAPAAVQSSIAAVWLAPLFPAKTWVKRARVLREDQMKLWRAAESEHIARKASSCGNTSNATSRLIAVDQWAIAEVPGMDGKSASSDGVHYHFTHSPPNANGLFAFSPSPVLHTVIRVMLTVLS